MVMTNRQAQRGLTSPTVGRGGAPTANRLSTRGLTSPTVGRGGAPTANLKETQPMPKLMTPVNPPSLAKPAGYSHGWEVQGGKTLYLAGQVAFDQDGKVVGKGDLVAQFRQV